MSAPQVGDNFPSDVVFTWIPPTPETAEFSACGIPTQYKVSESKFSYFTQECNGQLH